MAGKLKQIQVGNGIIIGVNPNDEITYRNGKFWTDMPGRFDYVTTGNGKVIGLTKGDGRVVSHSIPKQTSTNTKPIGSYHFLEYVHIFLMRSLETLRQLPRHCETLVPPPCTPETLVLPGQNLLVTPSLVKKYSNPDTSSACVVSTPYIFPHLFDMSGVHPNRELYPKIPPRPNFLPFICQVHPIR